MGDKQVQRGENVEATEPSVHLSVVSVAAKSKSSKHKIKMTWQN